MSERIKVQRFEFHDFMRDVQEYVQQGYEIDFLTNEGFPTGQIGLYECGMVKKKKAGRPPLKQKPALEDIDEIVVEGEIEY